MIRRGEKKLKEQERGRAEVGEGKERERKVIKRGEKE